MEETIPAPEMGDRVRDIVTGRTGVLTGTSEYLWGCKQFLLYVDGAKDKDGEPVTAWLDVGRLEILERGTIEAIAYTRTAELTAAFAGADVEAPTR